MESTSIPFFETFLNPNSKNNELRKDELFSQLSKLELVSDIIAYEKMEEGVLYYPKSPTAPAFDAYCKCNSKLYCIQVYTGNEDVKYCRSGALAMCLQKLNLSTAADSLDVHERAQVIICISPNTPKSVCWRIESSEYTREPYMSAISVYGTVVSDRWAIKQPLVWTFNEAFTQLSRCDLKP
jgi:hypothetical protein